MATTSDFSVGLAHKICVAAAEAGWTPDEFNALAQNQAALRAFRQVHLGHAEVTQVTHIIDCDAAPLIPYDNWEVEEHQKRGQFSWDPTKIKHHWSRNQMNGKLIEGNKLRQELAHEPTENANLLDYLLKYQHLIPEAWKEGKEGNKLYTIFWATIYRDADGDLYVRNLFFSSNGSWRAGDFSLDVVFGDRDPAAVRAS